MEALKGFVRKVDVRWIAVGFSLAALIFMMQDFRFFDLADAYWLKACFSARQFLQLERPRQNPIVLVTVTSQSIQKLGRWPWSRSVWGKITSRLEAGKARVIGYDIDFSSPAPGDETFAGSLRKNVLLPLWFEYVEQGKVSIKTPPIRAGFPSPPLFFKSTQGFVNVETSSLGVRRALLETDYDGKVYPSFPLEAYLMFEQMPLSSLTWEGKNLVTVDNVTIPLDRDGALWVNYKTAGFDQIPAEALLDPKFPDKNMFQGKIVLIGVTSPLGQDIKITPAGSMSGLEVQAQLLRNLVEGDFIAPLGPWVKFFLLLFLGLAAGIALPLFRWKRFLPWAALSAAAIVFLGFFAFAAVGIFVDIFAPILLVLAMTAAVLLVQSRRAEERLDLKIEELQMINQVSRLNTGNLSLEDLLGAALEMIQESSGVNTLGILLKDDDGRLALNIAKGIPCEQTERILLPGEGICGAAASSGKALSIVDLKSNPRAAKFERRLSAQSFLAVPFVVKDEVLGVLWIASSEPQFGKDAQIKLITMANQLAISIKNCFLSRKVSQLYLDAIRSLLRAVEYYQPSGKGHSERVASYALMIAKACSLPVEEMETIRSAALLHDIGRTGYFESLYRKPEGLTEEDWKQIFTPLKSGLKILEPLAGQFPILPILYHFFERYDGKGFPDGLKGSDIPIGARILAVANAFDDVSANGPQLGQVSLERAIQELKKEAGTLFDPDLVRIFVNAVSHVPAEEFIRGVKQPA